MVAAPCACGKFAVAKMYPLNVVPKLAELNMSLRFAAYVVPEFTLAVVNDLDVPSFLYIVNVIVPAVGVAPPPVGPNTSVVVFEIAIPVLKPGTTTA